MIVITGVVGLSIVPTTTTAHTPIGRQREPRQRGAARRSTTVPTTGGLSNAMTATVLKF